MIRHRFATLLTIAVLSLGLGLPAGAAPMPYVGGQLRYWVFSNHNDLRDVIAYWVPGPFHVTVEYWDYLDPNSPDQFRPEVGVHLRDARRSVYTIQWRHELDANRLTFGTDQILARGVVGRIEVSPIIYKDSTLTVVSAGADYYWGSYNFSSITVTHDPRAGDLWTVPMRVRFANESNDWLQATLAPASQGTIGWAVDGRFHGVRVGVEKNNRYDFTSVDNIAFTLGYEMNLRPLP
jgi:hypothetical protein